MSEPKQYEFEMSVDDFDASVLPPDAREPGTSEFKESVEMFLSKDLDTYEGQAEVEVDDEKIKVTWTTEGDWPDLQQEGIARLERDEYEEGIALLEMAKEEDPEDPNVLYNLGMALSDMGRLEEAEQHLRDCISQAPTHVNARVALGVALQRQDRSEEGIEEIQKALEYEPENPWAHRNLGAMLLQAGDVENGTEHLRRTTEIKPDDEKAWFGLAQALQMQDDDKGADEAYEKVIEINPHSDLAENARQARTQIAGTSFREKGTGGERPDAVMYCLGAMQRFDKMSEKKVRDVTMEIALKGRKGLDMNDPDSQYQLRSVPGVFSGLQLVCMLYVGFQEIAPERDVGVDLSSEYERAKQLYDEQQ